MDSLIFSSDPVWSQTTKSGFRQQVFVMYHATREVENVAGVLDRGFNISQSKGRNLLLGDGLYVSRDIFKTQEYGEVCFKLLVYPGKAVRVTEMADPLRTTWQSEFSSAWVPPTRGMGSGKEETCVKSSAQVRILGIAYGHEHLDPVTQSRVRNLFGTGDSLDRGENHVLDLMLEELGIVYSTFVHQGSNLMLEVSGLNSVQAEDWSGFENQLWSRTWDNCLENKATGKVLVSDGEGLWMEEVDAAGNREQRWRVDGKGRMVHKASNRLLALEQRGGGRVEMRLFREADRESWRFRCLDQTRTVDSFVQFTPWQDMLVWD